MQQFKVSKQVLSNGLTVLVMPQKTIPKVSTQLWYNVGSKHEKMGEKGIAHFIEHMIFKGTATLSECDINTIAHRLSGYCNAFTSFDYTGYLFDFPSQHWHEALPIMADCMRNCTFKQEFLNSELKAVIQELKMYKDDYASSIIEQLISAIFPDHPYHHPIIGYKQDLWSLQRENLVKFYNRHYVPNNATLVVVGDVEPQEAFEQAQKYFGSIKPDLDYTQEHFYHSPDLRSYSVTLYRAITQPLVMLCFVVPGAQEGKDYLIDCVSWVLAAGKGSRLYKKLVDELELVTDLQCFNYDLFEYGVLFMYFQPKVVQDIDKTIDKIKEIIEHELSMLAQQGVTETEVQRAIKKTEVEYFNLLESNQKQAYTIGKYYLALKDENYLARYTLYPKNNLVHEIQEFVAQYLRPSVMHQAKVLPITEQDKQRWIELQEISDQEDAQILAGKTRQAAVEAAKCAYDIVVHKPKPFSFPKAQIYYLSNGLKVLYHAHEYLPKIDIAVDFKAKYFYDPQDLQGLASFAARMLLEGTELYSATEFADILESYGMSIDSGPGQLRLSLFSADLEKGLELLNQVLAHARFEAQAIERVRAQMLAELDYYWDTPSSFVGQLAREQVYREHPYHKNPLGTIESIARITREDLLHYYKNFMSPNGTRLALVGNLGNYTIEQVLEQKLSSWQGPDVPDIDFPVLDAVKPHEINYPIVRDQIVLAYVGLSVDRLNPDYYKLLLFDQIFTGGVLGSMSSRLFDLRERSGLFYTIGGSLIARTDKQPGMIVIRTIVSPDRLVEAEQAIEQVINTAITTVTSAEFEEAQRAIINSLVDSFASNYKQALVYIYQDIYGLPSNYFDTYAQELEKITLHQMQDTVQRYLNTDKLAKIRIGRI